jgi:hypothetical protein
MRLVIGTTAVLATALALVGAAAADPINSPRVSAPGTLVCGDVTYTVVSPPGREPAGQIVTADGSDSTRVQIMILDNAAAFPQSMVTHCMFPDPEGFEVDLLTTPLH